MEFLDRTKVDSNQLEHKPSLIKAKRRNLTPDKEMCLDVSKQKLEGQFADRKTNFTISALALTCLHTRESFTCQIWTW